MEKRKMYYVSHPFTGDEEGNRVEARLFTAMLKCDGIILTGMWTKSRGCMAEKEAAQQEKMKIYELSICNFLNTPLLIEIGD